MNKAYNRINGGKGWENVPSIETPLNKQNLDKVDIGLDEVDNRVIALNTTKFNKTEAQGLIKNITFDLQTGILTKYYYNGSSEEINTGISKLNMNLRFDKESQILYIVNADGTEDPVDLSVFITNYEFEDSDTIAHNVSSDGTVTSIVKDGSIQERHMRPNYLADIKVEVAKAQASAAAADASKTVAAASASTAIAKAGEAATSAANAANSAVTATEKAEEAAGSADDAAASAATATQKATDAGNSADAAVTSATNAAGSASTATEKANAASASATAAAGSATSADTYAQKSQSYAVGGTGTREGEDSDNSQYYYEQTKRISQSVNGIIPMGTITFAELSDPGNQQPGYFFNVSDSFVSDERFKDGSGIFYGAGNNVLRTADGMWDVTAASMVSGVKGSKETEYRQGFVDLTPENIGALPENGNAVSATKAMQDGNGNDIADTYLKKSGDTKDNTVSFTSGDAANPIGWTDVELIASGETHSSLWRKVSLFFKNVRYLWKLTGNTSLSGIGDGTVTGAISALNTGISKIGSSINIPISVQTMPALSRDIEVGSITLPAGFWIIHVTIWYGPYYKGIRIGEYQIINTDHKPELIAFYNGPGVTLPVFVDSWEQHDIEIGPGSINAFRF